MLQNLVAFIHLKTRSVRLVFRGRGRVTNAMSESKRKKKGEKIGFVVLPSSPQYADDPSFLVPPV